MNKKQKSGIILASLASIAVAGSLIAGSTYALFTSESKTNIAVSSGTVNVTATISDLKTFSGVDLTGNATTDVIEATTTNGIFTNGGTAVINAETGDLELEKVTPGDKVTFKIDVKNNSNVAIKYRTIISCEDDTGLFGGLTFTINGSKFDGLNNKSNWTEMAASGTIATLNCEVNLPSDAGNDYQDTSCKVSYTVEAVQGNAATTDPDENVIEIDNAAQLGLFRDSVNKEEYSKYIGKTVTLTNDIDLDGADWTPIKLALPADREAITFDGNNKTVSNFKVDVGADGTKAAGFFSYLNCSILKNLKIDNAQIYGTNHVGAVVGHALCSTIENCHVTNSSVVTSTWFNGTKYDDGDKAGAIVGYLSAEPAAHVSGSSATNCTVKGYRDIGGLVGYLGTNSGSTTENAYVTGNTLKDITIINDRTNNYEGYTEDSKYDVNDVVGQQNSTSLVDSNTVDNVTTKIILADGFTKVSESKYEISNANGFDYWANSLNNKTSYANATIKLTANIDYDGNEFTPINLHQGVNNTNMVFDGGNYKISNISIKRTVKGYGLGIFSDVAGSSITIQNITFDHIVVDSRKDSTGDGLYNVIGVVMGYTYSPVTFKNVTVKNSEVYGYGKVGILVGMSAEPGNTLSFKDCALSNNTLSGAYNLGGLIGNYQRHATTNEEKLTFVNISITDTNVVFNCNDSAFEGPIIELTDATIICDESVKQTNPTCLGHGSTFSGQYVKCNRWLPTVYYFGFYGKYYISYGNGNHDCKSTFNSADYLIANSEKCINTL